MKIKRTFQNSFQLGITFPSAGKKKQKCSPRIVCDLFVVLKLFLCYTNWKQTWNHFMIFFVPGLVTARDGDVSIYNRFFDVVTHLTSYCKANNYWQLFLYSYLPKEIKIIVPCTSLSRFWSESIWRNELKLKEL